LLLACAGGIPDVEIPAEPIAIHYRTPEEARAHVKRLGRAPASPERAAGESARTARVPHVDEMRDLLQALLGGASESRDTAGRLVLLDARTGAIEPLEGARRGAIPLAWTSDRRRLLFAQPEARTVQIWELDGAEQSVRPITRGPRSHLQGCYLAQRRIAVVEAVSEAQGLRSMVRVTGPGGARPHAALSEGPVDHSPACAPEGDRVVWVAEPVRGRPRLLLADVAGGGVRQLGPGRDPVFTSDGSWIVFSARSGGRSRLWRIRPDGSGRAPLGPAGREAFAPAASPDGRHVAYVAFEGARRHLYLRRLDGTGDRLLFLEGDAEHPTW
jgi:Tol biopolymer transport system component